MSTLSTEVATNLAAALEAAIASAAPDPDSVRTLREALRYYITLLEVSCRYDFMERIGEEYQGYEDLSEVKSRFLSAARSALGIEDEG